MVETYAVETQRHDETSPWRRGDTISHKLRIASGGRAPPSQGHFPKSWMYNEPMSIFSGKHIILGVTGSIAAYKAADLASKDRKSVV